VKRRILGSIVGVTAVALLLLGIPLGLSVEHLYANQEVLRLEREASEARGTINPAAIGTGDPIELRHDGTTQFAVYDAAGERASGSGPLHADRAVRRALGGDAHDMTSGARLVVALPIAGNERVVGAMRASRPVSVVTERTHRTWLAIGLIALGALLVASLLAGWQARRLTRPVDALVASAEQLGAGDFAARAKPSGIDELDHLGAALDRTGDRLDELVRRERSFSADASHQLRTPIAGLRVRIESALATPNADLRAALEESLVPVDQLESTVDDLLALARDTHADRPPLEVERLLRDTEDTWHGRFAAAGRPLRVEVEAGVDAPLVSEPAVRQVLEVLMANAFEHGAGVVSLRARHAPGAVAIDVSDEGRVRLDPSRVFERRVGRTNGIGLALARTLAEAEGGRLVLDPPGPHPTFTVVFPSSAPGAG
jgi:signal transduction histidine kinase